MVRVALEEWGLYNNNILVCKWWDADTDEKKIIKYYTRLREIHDIKPYDDLELFNADWEGSELINESTPFSKVKAINEILESLNCVDKKKFDYLIWEGYTMEDATERLDDVEIYEDLSFEELAGQFIDEGIFGDIPDAIAGYIDYKKLGRDLSFDYVEFGGDLFRCA